MTQVFQYTVNELLPYIDWAYFYHAWQVKGETPLGEELKADALKRLGAMDGAAGAQALYREVHVHSEGDDIIVDTNADTPTQQAVHLRLPMLRQQRSGADGHTLCLADFVRPDGDMVGLFATCCTLKNNAGADPYESLMVQTLATRLAEAAAEKLDDATWPSGTAKGIRPAIGYPCLPDLSLNFLLDELTEMGSIGITLTENGAMSPQASVSGFVIRHPAARYFSIGIISEEQFFDYTRRRSLPAERMRQFLRAVMP